MGLIVLIPIAIAMGVAAFLVFLWTIRHGQYEDMEGAAHRILDPVDTPIPDRKDPVPPDGETTNSSASQAAPDGEPNRSAAPTKP